MDALVTITGPATPVATGSSFSCTATIKNTGTEVWQCVGTNAATPVRLGAMPQDTHPWGPWRFELPRDIQPGETFTLPMSGLTALSTPGTFPCQWKMVKEQIAWFGQVGECVVMVQSGTSPPPVSPPPVSPPPVPPPPSPPTAPIFGVVTPNPLPVRGDSDDPVTVRVFNQYYTSDGLWRALFWKNDTGERLAVVKTYLWTGVDGGGVGDVHAEVCRVKGPNPTIPQDRPWELWIESSALLAMLQWDHYAEPTLPAGVTWDFSRPHIIEPDDYVAMRYCSTVGAPRHSHHVFDMSLLRVPVG